MIGRTKHQLLLCHKLLSPRIAQTGHNIGRQLSSERANWRFAAPTAEKHERLEAPPEAGFHASAPEYCSFRIRFCHSEEAALAPAIEVTAIGPRKFRARPAPVSEGWISGPGSMKFTTRKSAGTSIAGQLAPILLSELLAVRRFAAPDSVCLRLVPGAPSQTPKDFCVQVLVRDNNVDQALKALKKKMQREGIFREMKLRGHYEKPSEKRAREKAEALRRARKLARKKLQREGLLPMKAKPAFPAR